MLVINLKEGAEFFSEWSVRVWQSSLQSKCLVRCVVVNMRLFDWRQSYLWPTADSCQCISDSSACIWLAVALSHVCVTVPRPWMWTDFLLWHLIWLTWHQQATVASHNCHLLTERGNRNRKRRKRLSSRDSAMGERMRRGRRIYLYRTGTFGGEVAKKREKTHRQRERIFIFLCGSEKTDHTTPLS